MSLEKLGAALVTLKRIIEEPLDGQNIIRDSCLHRFKYVIELYWRSLQGLLKERGIVVSTPRQVFSSARQAEWLEEEKTWFKMWADRKLIPHAYEEEVALSIYQHIKLYYPVLEHTYKKLLTL